METPEQVIARHKKKAQKIIPAFNLSYKISSWLGVWMIILLAICIDLGLAWFIVWLCKQIIAL